MYKAITILFAWVIRLDHITFYVLHIQEKEFDFDVSFIFRFLFYFEW